MNLKPNEEIQVGALVAAGVYGIFQLNSPNLSDVKAAPPGSQVAHGSVKTAAWTAAVFVSGLAILAKSPTIYVIGGAMIVAESWKYFHANRVDPATGKPAPAAAQG